MKIALVHLATRETPQATLEKALELLQESQSQGANLAILPELFPSVYNYAVAHQTPEILASLQSFASQSGMTLVAGVLEPTDIPGRFANRARVLGPAGELGCYTKTHLIPAFKEPENMIPGNQFVTLETGGFRAGVAICFDLRFPELFRSYTLMGVDLFLIPSAWPASRAYAWELFCKSRAAENQAYLMAVNHAEDPFGAASLAIDPLGMEMARVEQEGFKVVELEADYPKRLRQDFPVLTQRRPDLYQGLLNNGSEGFRQP